MRNAISLLPFIVRAIYNKIWSNPKEIAIVSNHGFSDSLYTWEHYFQNRPKYI